MDEDELERFIEFAADDLASPEISFEPLLPERRVRHESIASKVWPNGATVS